MRRCGARARSNLPDEGDSDVDVDDNREEELRLFNFATFPLRAFSIKDVGVVAACHLAT